MKTETLIKKYADCLDWLDASRTVDINQIDEQLIAYCKYFWDWDFISKYQILSEYFMKKWKSYINWYKISRYQNLSETFIKKWKMYLNFNLLKMNKKIKELHLKQKRNLTLYEN